jgi:hypothetical protein
VLYEYAVEPDLASTWHDRKEGRYFLDSFGQERGRVLSRYPKHWTRLVWEASRDLGEVGRKRMEEVLAQLSQAMVARGAVYDGTRTWLENARAEHTRSPFRAVLVRAKTGALRDAIAADALETDPLWAVPMAMAVPRKPAALAAAISPMLRLASEMVFVDPHFTPTKRRYIHTMRAFLQAAFDERPGPDPTRVEIHHANDGVDAEYFEAECKKQLHDIVPEGFCVRIVRWRQREGGERLHNRYILTDIGGVQFGIGLDAPDGEEGQMEDLNRLGREQRALRWAQYAGANPAFEPAGEVTVVGRGRRRQRSRTR